MGVYRSVSGMVRVEWIGADIQSALGKVLENRIPLYEMEAVDEVTVRFWIRRSDLKKIRTLADRRGDRMCIVSRKGIFWWIKEIFQRPVLLFGLSVLVILGTILPRHIFFIHVEGNDTVPSRYILEAAENLGIGFGTNRRQIRSEQVKNGLLDAIPQLQWAGVNTYGCRAVITVRERADTQQVKQNNTVGHVVASVDGVIESCTVTNGTGVCMLGQAVRAGDILISGYTDCGITVTAELAQGEVFAQTRHDLNVVMASNQQLQSPIDSQETNFSLLIGKKRINFYKGSGISGGSCDKMYWKYVLTLPGGFQLPLSLIKETVVSCNLTDSIIEDGPDVLDDYASSYLATQMIAGQVKKESERFEKAEGIFRLTGTYDCTESIGKVQEEMIGDFNGKSNGANRERRSGG